MERDTRRDRGQWRGCHSFKDIVCDGEAGINANRNGGLKMGHTYYYYYEIDGSTETHDPTLPSTTACPYLPGQTVNKMWVPMEQASRLRSASMTSMRSGNFQTLNPDDKFVAPRAAPPVPEIVVPRVGTAPHMKHKKSARSLSPCPTWPRKARKLFSRWPSTERGRKTAQGMAAETVGYGHTGATFSDGTRSRDISPESLRKLLSDEMPCTVGATDSAEKPSLIIPDIIEDDIDDDDNFATSATAETSPFTVLSPPPRSRSCSRPTTTESSETPRNGSQVLLATLPKLTLDSPRSHFSVSSASTVTDSSSPLSPHSNVPSSFFDSEDDDDDEMVSSNDGELSSHKGKMTTEAAEKKLETPFAGYTLPSPSIGGKKKYVAQSHAPVSPAFVARNDMDLPTGNTSLLTAPINAGLDDFINDLGWMDNVIGRKAN